MKVVGLNEQHRNPVTLIVPELAKLADQEQVLCGHSVVVRTIYPFPQIISSHILTNLTPD
jgi:hypothetical protein